jgi:hypothetical protein
MEQLRAIARTSMRRVLPHLDSRSRVVLDFGKGRQQAIKLFAGKHLSRCQQPPGESFAAPIRWPEAAKFQHWRLDK